MYKITLSRFFRNLTAISLQYVMRFFLGGLILMNKNVVYDKPFLTTLELLKKLEKDYKLAIGYTDFEFNLLETVSYYDLINGYKECFMENEIYKYPYTLLDLFSFSTFDREFQNILFKYSVYAENCFKNRFSCVLSKNFGVSEKDYLNINNYISSTYNYGLYKKLRITLSNIENVINSEQTDNPTKFYKNVHNHIPAWILFKNVNFSDCIDLFSFLPKNLKLDVIKFYFDTSIIKEDDSIRLFKNMLTIIRKFRNKIAHNHKFLTYKVPLKYALSQKKLIKINPYQLMRKRDLNKKKTIGQNDIFSFILSLSIVVNNHMLNHNMLSEISSLFQSESNNLYKKIDVSKLYIKFSNLPEDFLERISKIDFWSLIQNQIRK